MRFYAESAKVSVKMDAETSEWNLNSRISALLQKEATFDVTFEVGEPPKKFPCHTLILAAGSRVFEAMFFGNFPEKSTIKLPDVTTVGFESMLHYLYSDKVTLRSEPEALEVAYCAKKYMIQTLFESCEKYLLKHVSLSPENVFPLHEEASFLDMRELQAVCLRYISRNAKKIFRSKSFADASSSSLEDILKMDIMDIDSECDLIEALWHWGEAQCLKKGLESTSENIRSFIKDFLKHIRFLTVSVEDFGRISGKGASILDVSEQMSVLLSIGMSKALSDPKMPSEFSSKSRARSFTNCGRLQIPVEYRYDDSLSASFLTEHTQRLTISLTQPHHHQVTIVGVVIAFKPVSCYSPDHRTLDIDVRVWNEDTNASSGVKASLKSVDGTEVNQELVLEEYVVVSSGEMGVLEVDLKGEGVLLQQSSRKCFTEEMGNNVSLKLEFGSSGDRRILFPVKEILCI